MSNRDKVVLVFVILWFIISVVGWLKYGVDPNLTSLAMIGSFIVLIFIPSKLCKRFKDWLDK